LNKAVGDVFGHDVAMSADGTTIAVGAFHEDSPGTGVNHINKGDGSMDSGAVYVFVRVGDAWQHQAYIKASNTGPGDEFGTGWRCRPTATLSPSAPILKTTPTTR
jgi:hypothetical protein